jgi:hypothetical protein
MQSTLWVRTAWWVAAFREKNFEAMKECFLFSPGKKNGTVIENILIKLLIHLHPCLFMAYWFHQQHHIIRHPYK